MTRLEIRQKPMGDEGVLKEILLPRVFLDGVMLSEAHAFDRALSGKKLDGYDVDSHIRANDSDDPLLHVTLDQVEAHINRLTAHPKIKLNDSLVDITAIKKNGTWFRVRFSLIPHKDSWKNPWSVAEFAQDFACCVRHYAPDGQEDDPISYQGSNNIYVIFPIDKQDTTLSNELNRRKDQVEALVTQTREKLLASLSETSLVQPFNFPEEILTPCAQYLLYFVQFLKDVGIEARAEIRHESGEAGEVLFSVTPADGEQALDRVRQALELYLKLSQSPKGKPDFSALIEVQALQRQIRYLQNELDFAEEKIAQKNITLEFREEQVAQLKERQVFDRAQIVPMERKSDEPEVSLFKGTVKLKRFDAKIADIDVPKIYSLLKEWLVGPYQNETLASYFQKNGFRLLESSEPALPPAEDFPALPPVTEKEIP